jgi:cyanophycinase-like exopeptidase
VWDSFQDRPLFYVERAKELKYTGTDQAHICTVLKGNEKTWGVDDGVYNFNTRVRKAVKSVYKRTSDSIEEITTSDGSLPKGAKMVFFNGKYDPSQRFLQQQYPWIKANWHV